MGLLCRCAVPELFPLPVSWYEQSPPSPLTENKIQPAVASLQFLAACWFPSPEQTSLPTNYTVPHCNITFPQGEGLWGTLYMQLLPGIVEIIKPELKQKCIWLKATSQEDTTFTCPLLVSSALPPPYHSCKLLPHQMSGMSELIQTKLELSASFPNVLMTSYQTAS